MLIQKNPLTIIGTIDPCWLFVYKTPVDNVKQFLPPQLEPVQHHDYAFWNVVVCQVKHMRPKLSPFPFGITYWHIAYRLYVQLRSRPANNIEGLYFLRSDCNNSLMSAAGNVLTDFNFHTASVAVSHSNLHVEIKIAASSGDAYAKLNTIKSPTLPPNSPFNSLEEASQFLKYKPNGISIGSNGMANVVHIVRDEQAWKSKLVTVEEASWSFLKDKNVSLEICYEVEPILYQWNRAKTYSSIEH